LVSFQNNSAFFENFEGITNFSSRAQISPFGGVRESLAFEDQTLEQGGGGYFSKSIYRKMKK
jgi:hypothetical protein